MELILKKTTELSDDLITQINNLFYEVFDKKRSISYFKHQHQNTIKGYSYHSLLLDNDKLVGFHTIIPFYYYAGNLKFIAGLGIDSMIQKNYRDYFNIRDLFVQCEKFAESDGCALRIGFPNDNSYPLLKKGFKYKDIGRLDTFFLPIRIGAVKKNFKFLNPISYLLSSFYITLSSISNDKKIYSFKYRKDRETFDKVRYKWGDADYEKIEFDNVVAYYKIQDFKGVKTAFIIDINNLSKRNFDKAVLEIYKIVKRKVDMIIYVGYLPFKPLSLIKMPPKYEPKHFHFTCKLLKPELFDNSLLEIKNWEVNLSNYDLL